MQTETRPATPQECADALGVTLDEYQADRLGALARTLTESTGIPHLIFKQRGDLVVLSDTMGAALGLEQA